MEFAVCPSCRQSVLDDDAVECPFCGAPMKGGKGGAAPKPAGGPAAAKPGTAAGVKPGAVGKAKPGAGGGDDLPFDTPASPFGSQQLQASPRPGRGRDFEIRCPMCETVGYIPESAAGQTVKCANSKCLVPLFQAPQKVAAPPPPKPKAQPRYVLVGGLTVAVVAVGGGLAYYFATLPSAPQVAAPSKVVLSEEDRRLLFGTGDSTPTNAGPPPGTGVSGGALPVGANGGNPQIGTGSNAPGSTADNTPDVDVTSPEFTAQLFKECAQLALQGQQNRSKPFCRLLTMEMAAIRGDQVAAKEQLEAFNRVGKDVIFYRIPGLVELAWTQFNAKSTAEAKKTVQQALQDAAKLPKVGRNRLTVASRLAAVALAVGLESEADQLLATHSDQGEEGLLAEQVQVAVATGRYDISDELRSQPVIERGVPVIGATVGSLVARGQPLVALNWLRKQATVEAKMAGLVRFADARWAAMPADGPADAVLTEIETDLKELPAERQALIHARLGLMALRNGQRAIAKTLLESAAAAANQVAEATEFTLPTAPKEFQRLKLPSAASGQVAFSGLAETILLAARLGEKERVETLTRRSVKLARSLGPTLSRFQQLQDEFDQLGPTAMRERLKETLELKSNDQARQELEQYRSRLGELKLGAELRSSLIEALYARLIDEGQATLVWDDLRVRVQERDADRNEPWGRSSLGALLEQAFQSADLAAEQRAFRAVWPTLPGAKDKLALPLDREVRAKVMAGEVAAAAKALTGAKLDPVDRDRTALSIATAFQSPAELDARLKFVSQLDDSVLREELFQLVAALASRQQQHQAIWKQFGATVQVTEKLSLARGLIAGLPKS